MKEGGCVSLLVSSSQSRHSTLKALSDSITLTNTRSDVLCTLVTSWHPLNLILRSLEVSRDSQTFLSHCSACTGELALPSVWERSSRGKREENGSDAQDDLIRNDLAGTPVLDI